MVVSCLRRSCVAWLADQHVRVPSLISAIAHDGPIEPCVCIAKSYVAASHRAARGSACSTSPTSLVTSFFTTAVSRTCCQSRLSSGSPAQADHVARSCRAAVMAPHSVLATTPRKLPRRTTFTKPGTLLTDASSTLCSAAPMAGGRTTRPCSMPGTRTFCMKVNRPVDRKSTRLNSSHLVISYAVFCLKKKKKKKTNAQLHRSNHNHSISQTLSLY